MVDNEVEATAGTEELADDDPSEGRSDRATDYVKGAMKIYCWSSAVC